MDKQSIRKSNIQLRKSIDPAEFVRNSHIICSKLAGLPEYKSAKNVMAYYPVNNEVDIRCQLSDILRTKTLFLPVIDDDGVNMSVAVVSDMDKLVPGGYNIPAPAPGSIIAPKDGIDLIIVPLVAFDESGCRIGYGGGFYDRFLADVNCLKVGVAFELQKVQRLNCQAHDVKMDIIITEKNLYDPRLK